MLNKGGLAMSKQISPKWPRWTERETFFEVEASPHQPFERYLLASSRHLPELGSTEADWREEWMKENVAIAIAKFWNVVSASPDVRGGVPVLRDTRMPLSRVFAELADGFNIVEIAADFELDASQLETLLGSLSMFLDQPFTPPDARIPTR